jgi:hypothetical protein
LGCTFGAVDCDSAPAPACCDALHSFDTPPPIHELPPSAAATPAPLPSEYPEPRNASELATVPGVKPAALNKTRTRSRMCSNLFFPKFAPPYTLVTTHATPTASRLLSSARIEAPPRVSPSSSKPLATFTFFGFAGFVALVPPPTLPTVPTFGTRHALMAWSMTSPVHVRLNALTAAVASDSENTGNARWATKTEPRSMTACE